MTTMSATVFTPAPALPRPAVRPVLRPILRALLAAAAILAIVAGTIALRFGIYVAGHRDMPVILHLFDHGH